MRYIEQKETYCNPWKRKVDGKASNIKSYSHDLVLQRPKFLVLEINKYLDINTKRAALSVSPSVVSLVSYTGEEELYQCSGVIVESDDNHSGIILSTANLIRPHTDYGCAENVVAGNLKVVVNFSDGRSINGELRAYDFHFNFVVISFMSDSPIQAATLRLIDDSNFIESGETSFQLRQHSTSMSIAPGDDVVAVGRYFASPFNVMAAPGEYCVDRCKYECKELFMTTCRMTRCGDGSPLLNDAGEVIGMAFFDISFTPFMPINVAYKWWEHYKIHGESRLFSLGMEAIAFYSGPLKILEKVIQRSPNISKGIIVKKVISGSSAESAGLLKHDVIVQCGGRVVRSFLQFFEIIWDNVGYPVDLVVVRADHNTPITLKLMVVEPTASQLNSWPRWNSW